MWKGKDNVVKLSEGTYFITGITGYIGFQVVQELINSYEYRNSQIKIIGLVRDCKKAEKLYKNYDCRNLKIIQSDIIQSVQLEQIMFECSEHPIDYIIHCAATTKSNTMITNPVETADGIVLGTKNILELAHKFNIKSMVYLSSMEVYGNIPDNGETVTEDKIGYIDILLSRSCYPLGKRMAENYCYCYYKEYGVPVKIARLAQTFGTGILPGESRIFAQFANSVRTGSDIVLHTAGDSMGNYCDCLDVVYALFTLLQKGEEGEAYNVVNEENTMKIREMAELVANKLTDGKIKVIYDIPEENGYGYAYDTGLRLSSTKLRKLGWNPTTDLEGMYRNMIEWMNYNYILPMEGND